jgi:hypothetical protein
MLWHLAIGHLPVRRLLPLVRLFGRLPEPFSRAFTAVLNAATKPFHYINYAGGVGGGLVLHGPRLTRLVDLTMTDSITAWTPKPTTPWRARCTAQSAGTRSSQTR